jgi:methionyl-tRNA synthetase
MSTRFYISTTIPYVNARPHIGFALELVQADVLARYHRQAGDEVRFQSGTDDNSLKNVLAAHAQGISTAELVDRNAAAFAALREPLQLSFDDFIRTSSDPRHRPGVDRLWQACTASGDFYRKEYSGLYCVSCEQFYKPGELCGGRCPEHGTEPERVGEENWFFRLSRYSGQLHDLISSGRLTIEPAAKRNEVLAFIEGGLDDFSVSRSVARARGWGIPVPGDPSQVIYVWWDALGNYITALGFGSDGDGYQRWWAGASRRVHLVGKGVLRFHAVYWPAILLSAGQPLPTDILVHDYLTLGGSKISKSGSAGDGLPDPAGGGVPDAAASWDGLTRREATDPAALAARYGTDAVRWWLLREVPRLGDADFTPARLVASANDDLAGGLGNLVSRVVTLAHRFRQGTVPRPRAGGPPADPGLPGPAGGGPPAYPGLPVPAGHALAAAVDQLPERIAAGLASFDFRSAVAAICDVVGEANRCLERVEPWRLARAERDGDAGAGRQLDETLRLLIRACASLGSELSPFLPGLAGRICSACDDSSGRLPEPQHLFPRLQSP